jgi:hypothetical protein
MSWPDRGLDDEQVRKRDVVLAASWLVPGAGHLMLGMRVGWLLLAIFLACAVPTWTRVLPLPVGIGLGAVPWLAAQLHLWRHVARMPTNGPRA